MKKATITEFAKNFRMGCGCENWCETVPVKAAEADAVCIEGHFEYAEAAVAVRDGHIVEVSVADECTWWDDPNSKEFLVPEEGETIKVIGWRTTSSKATWIRSPQHHNLSSNELRNLGAWRDAEVAEAAEKSRRKAAYEAVVKAANDAYGRHADEVLKAHVRWAFEDEVIDLVHLLLEAPAVARALKHVPGGTYARLILKEFDPVEGPDYLEEAMNRVSGPRMESAIKIANLILGERR